VEAWLADTVPGLLAATATPGLSIALAHRGRIHTAGFGELDAASVVPAGSMAKPYTAVAALQLVERGLIGLDEPVQPHLPDVDLANPHGGRAISVRDLLSFRSGLATDTTSARLNTRPPPLRDHVRRALSEPVLREYHAGIPRWAGPAGERYRYSNLGVAVLGLLVETLAGRGFAEHVAASVIEPLGLRATAFAPDGDPDYLPEHIRAALCPGHARFGRRLLPTPAIRSADFPANGLFTTAAEHLRLLLALRDGGGGLLAPETVRLMRTPQAPLGDARIAADGSWQVGLGLILAGTHFGHPGSHMWGWWHVSRVYPELDLAVVAMTNCWDMLRWQDPANEEPASVLVDALAAWAVEGAPRPLRRPWEWRRSYVAGLILAERTLGFLAAGGDLDVAAGAEWDRAALAQGIADVRDAPCGRDPIGRLARAGRLQVGRFELDLLATSLGARRDFPLPLWFWD
jgi:CubicO group peptidase (beta-lactamase class C family)